MALVNTDNFVRAESDRYFASLVHDGGFGRLFHYRDVTPIDRQTVIRMNRDTLYSAGVFDLEAGPVTVTFPDPGERFMSMMVLDEDHYVHGVVYAGGRYTFTRDDIGTRYMFIAFRTFVDPSSAADLDEVHALQDAIEVEQERQGVFEVPNWDPVSQQKVRNALLALGRETPDSRHAFGSRAEVDPLHHLIGTALAWGGNPEQDAMYLNVNPEHDDGATVYRLTVGDVPVDGFWSISVYNARGFFEKNAAGLYSVNNVTAKRGSDGAVRIQFGGTTDDPTVNLIPITKGWNYIVRMYRPRTEVIDGAWTFPVAEPVPA